MQFNVDPNLNNNGPNRKVIILDTCTNLRAKGRNGLAGNWLPASIVMFIYMVMLDLPVVLIDGLFGQRITVDLGRDFGLGEAYNGVTYSFVASPMSNVYTFLVLGALTFGTTLFIMSVYRNKRGAVGDIFRGFEFYVRATGLFLYILLFTILWFLIPIAGLVLGPMAAIRYSMSYFVMLDHPEYPIPMCVNESKRLMFGNKMKYFTLQLSFLGWMILASIPSAIITSFLDASGFDAMANFGSMMIFETVYLVAMAAMYPVMAYVESTSMAFYEVLIGREEAEVYYPESNIL